MSYFAHGTAVVDPDTTVGENTAIWHFCHVCSGAHIGPGCTLGQNVYVGGDAVIGEGVKIQNNVSVYDGVHLEDDVFVGPSAVFTNVTHPRAQVNRRDEFEPTRVGRGTTIGANATVMCGTILGAYAFVGAGAVVVGNIADHRLVVGNPARPIGWVCRCGEHLAKPASQTTCQRCGRRYELAADELTVVPR